MNIKKRLQIKKVAERLEEVAKHNFTGKIELDLKNGHIKTTHEISRKTIVL